jgi:hypothetical protein
MTAEKLVVVAAKLPQAERSALDRLAADRLVTVSSLIRSLIIAALAEATGQEAPGDVELSVRARLESDYQASRDPRAQVLLNLARRLDTSSTGAAPIAAQVRALLDDLMPTADRAPRLDSVSLLRMSVRLAMEGVELLRDVPPEVVDEYGWERVKLADPALGLLEAAGGRS